MVFNGDLCQPSQYKAQVQWLRNHLLPQLLFEDHLSRVSGPGKLFFSNPLFYLLILSIVHPELSGLSHLSKPYDCPSLASSKTPFFSVKQKQEMEIVSKTIFPLHDLLLNGNSTNSASAFNNWILSRQGIQWLQSRQSFPPTPPRKELIYTCFANGSPKQIKVKKRELVKRMIEPYGLNFTPGGILCLKASLVRITPFLKGLTTTWRNLPLQLFSKFPPGGFIFSKVLWEIA